MPRMTRILPCEHRYMLEPARVEPCEGGFCGEAVDRLAAFENMQEALLRQVRDIPAQLAAMRAQGKEKTVTFRELTGQKMLVQEWLAMARAYGVEDEP